MDTRAEERCLPRRITPRSNMTPSACSAARIREKHAISRSDTLQIHSARNTNSNGQPTNDQADLQQVHRASAATGTAGFPNRRSILPIRPRAHYTMRRNSRQEMRNLMAPTASAAARFMAHYIQQVGSNNMRWSWSEATALHPLWTLRGLERRMRATPPIRINEGFPWLLLLHHQRLQQF